MPQELVVSLGRQALWTVLVVAAPMLGLAMAVGVFISLLQAATQIQEQTLTFVPKVIVVFVAGLVFGPWMMQTMVEFAGGLLGNLAGFIR